MVTRVTDGLRFSVYDVNRVSKASANARQAEGGDEMNTKTGSGPPNEWKIDRGAQQAAKVLPSVPTGGGNDGRRSNLRCSGQTREA